MKLQPRKFERHVLTLNSHSLSYFQRCEQFYQYAVLENLILNEPYYPFDRGALISKIMELWYRARRRNYGIRKLQKLENKLFKILLKANVIREDDRLQIAGRIMEYFNKYRSESYKIVAVEQGFSKVLYEDSNVLFIYEGRPDLVVDFGRGMGIGPIDHKTESRKSDIYMFNNQMIGYCWAINSKLGIYNFIGLQKDSKDGDVLRRTTCNFSDSQIEQWRADTIKWYYRILAARQNKKFLRSWNCDGKYGICQYAPICEMASDNGKLIKIKNLYKVGETYKSW